MRRSVAAARSRVAVRWRRSRPVLPRNYDVDGGSCSREAKSRRRRPPPLAKAFFWIFAGLLRGQVVLDLQQKAFTSGNNEVIVAAQRPSQADKSRRSAIGVGR